MACLILRPRFAAKAVCDRNTINLSKILYRFSSVSQSSRAEESSSPQNDIAEYPPVKPRYPPGLWGNVGEVTAWRVHQLAHDQLAIPRVKERLESIAGETGRIIWKMTAMDARPNNLDFRQHVTKTHIIKGLPSEIYDSIDVDSAYGTFQSLIPEIILQEHEYLHKQMMVKEVGGSEGLEDEGRYMSHRLMSSVIRTLMTGLQPFGSHLIRSQVDEDVRVETFWQCGGFAGSVIRGKRVGDFLGRDGKCLGVIPFQYKDQADFQIRTELPLPQFIAEDSPVCREGFVPQIDYAPVGAGLRYIHDRPITVSGHWIGDPCEHCLLSLHTLPTAPYNTLLEAGKKYADNAELSFGLAAAFGSCVSQAYNQGFTEYLELTYPVTTQCVVVSGNSLRVFAYQLNTLHPWNDAKARHNILWASEPMQMFNRIEDGKVIGLNDDTFKTLAKLFLVKPVDRGVDLRPYLPEEESPAKKSLYINFKGEEPLPLKKIERWQYPRNAVYF